MTAKFSLSQISDIAQQVLSQAADRKVILFHGEMGAGKTTFIKALCAELGATNPVSSPTFSLVNEYEYPAGLIYHFDCYRLKTPTEALDMGIEEYLYSGQFCLIEWPEKMEGLWPERYLSVSLSAIDPNTRHISIETVG